MGNRVKPLGWARGADGRRRTMRQVRRCPETLSLVAFQIVGVTVIPNPSYHGVRDRNWQRLACAEYPHAFFLRQRSRCTRGAQGNGFTIRFQVERVPWS